MRTYYYLFYSNIEARKKTFLFEHFNRVDAVDTEPFRKTCCRLDSLREIYTEILFKVKVNFNSNFLRLSLKTFIVWHIWFTPFRLFSFTAKHSKSNNPVTL